MRSHGSGAAGEISHQHHATELESGNILIFDNGSHSRNRAASRIVEVNPETKEIDWTYEGSPVRVVLQFVHQRC